MTGLQENYDELIASGELRDDPAQRRAIKELDRVSNALEASSRKRSLFSKRSTPPAGLYLWGGVGRGKSMLMDMFVSSIDFTATRRVHFHGFMQDVHAGMKRARDDGHQDALAPVADALIKDVSLLALDEMQISDIADAMIVGRLFERLLDAGVCVVTTSNRHPSDLYKDGLNRALFLPFIALMEDRLMVHELAADTDYRQERLLGEAVYFSPLGPEASQAIDRIWTNLTNDQHDPLRLEVNGRELVLERFHNGSARAEFEDLCGRALGAADYLAVSDAVRVLVLENIPQLGRDNFDKAKRFVTLIDTLYEAGVRLIASAQAQPESLYTQGAGSFEFERTASRLREMQAADWGESA